MFPPSKPSSFFSFPDVCKVPSPPAPPMPIPYPNIASPKQLAKKLKLPIKLKCMVPECPNFAEASLPGPFGKRLVCLECYKKTTGQFPLPAGKPLKLPNASGDEAGTMGGLISGKQMGPARFKQGLKVKIEGAKPPSLLDYHQGQFIININP